MPPRPGANGGGLLAPPCPSHVRHQYQGDELIGRRFEQCPSEDVLADTIVKGKLPGTGGPFPMLVLGIAAVALGTVAGIVVLRRS